MDATQLETIEDLQKVVNYLSSANDTLANKQLAFRAIKKAQFFKDLDLEFEARYQYMSQCTFLNFDEELIAQFPWFLNICDQHPDRFRYRSVLWSFKWVLDVIPEYHKVSLQQIDSLLQDFEARYRAFGAADKIIQHYYMKVYVKLGNEEKARQAHEKYKQATSNHVLLDCRACQSDNLLNIFLMTKEYQTLLDTAKPILNGQISCTEVPLLTYPKAMMAAMMLGNWELAEVYASKAQRHLNKSVTFPVEYSQLLLFYTIKEDFVSARAILEQQLPLLMARTSDYLHFHFYLAAGLFLQAMVRAENSTVKLNFNLKQLPFDIADKDGEYPTTALSQWFNEQAKHRAGLLDGRNGNGYYMGYLEEMREWTDQQLVK
ncbi:hypothetical protein JMN32_19005 [Fulvivirga sp. 29W222]|uniref:Uncharacterized protein n=1 Tax=Fulvivirga marina TaxID=2494733 RepID=A0A937G1R8_9BACT|nr:hypothetical protein [Fulvivirga marina]MBL6448410.1 hypothetical protein [Fulvivirga marina]